MFLIQYILQMSRAVAALLSAGEGKGGERLTPLSLSVLLLGFSFGRAVSERVIQHLVAIMGPKSFRHWIQCDMFGSKVSAMTRICKQNMGKSIYKNALSGH